MVFGWLWPSARPPGEESVGPEFVGGQHWAFVAAEQALAVEDRKAAEAQRAKRKDAVLQQHAEREQEEKLLREAEEAEAQRLLMEQEEARREKKKERKELQRERARLRDISAGLDIDDGVERLCAALPLDDVTHLCTELTAMSITQRTATIQAKVQQVDAEAESRRQELVANFESYTSAAGPLQKDPWSEEELHLLDKALRKFPQGTAKRWEQMSAYVRTRSVDEVVEMVKVHMAAGNTALQKSNQGLVIAKKREGNRQIKDEATSRCEVLTDVQLNLKGDAAAKFEGRHEGVETKVEGADNTGAEAWSEVQELALVKALKTFGKDLGQERWIRVAEAVPRKSRAECIRRFKEIRESFRASKMAGCD